jgi:hypothetical protein
MVSSSHKNVYRLCDVKNVEGWYYSINLQGRIVYSQSRMTLYLFLKTSGVAVKFLSIPLKRPTS